MKSNKQKKTELVALLVNTLDRLEGFPKALKMLGKSSARAIDENKIDEILDGALDFLSGAFAKVEEIRFETVEVEQATPLQLVPVKTGTDDV